MKLSNKIKSVSALLGVKFLHSRLPLAVRWQLTSRCGNRCVFCNIWTEPKTGELTTNEVLKLVDSLKKAGTQTISFSGGEPLLREDIEVILKYCREKKISTSLNSNASLVVSRVRAIRTLDLLKLSLNGPEPVHDRIAGCPGSFKNVLTAAIAAQSEGIRTIFTATLTKYNIRHLDSILEIAGRFNTLVAFQPLKRLSKGIEELGPIMPEPEDYRKAVGELIRLKKAGDKRMRNSLDELLHIWRWPDYRPLACWAGMVFCMIGTAGELYPCDRIKYSEDLPNCVELGFKKAFANLKVPVHCQGCGFCGTLELNLLLSGKIGSLGTIRKIA